MHGFTIESDAKISDKDLPHVEKAFEQAKSKKWDKALDQAVKAKSAIPAKFIRWLQIIDPKKDVSFSEIAAFISHNPEWPQQSALQRRAEEAMELSIPAQSVIQWFNGRQPISANGHIRLTDALVQLNRTKEAEAQIRRSWVEVNFGRDQAKQFYDKYKKFLRKEDHIARVDRLLWEGRTFPAKLMLPYLDQDWKALTEARITLRDVKGGVDRAVAKVPAKLEKNEGLLFERMRWRRIKGLDLGARELLFSAPEVVSFPEVWWKQRSILARNAIRMGHYSEAYRIVKNHSLPEGTSYADAEWLAGWIKLRFLSEPDEALVHFTNLDKAVAYPISKSRAAYWIARSYEASKNKENAKIWYDKAADYSTTYYGQLAAERIGRKIKIEQNNKAVPNSQEKILFQESELVAVIDFLKKIGEREHMRSFIYQLNTMSTTPGWRTLVAELAVQSGRPDLAVHIGKKALQDGHGVINAAYPVLDEELLRKTPEVSLVHSVVRQESAFYENAISSVGARGLMQLMPATASKLAKDKNYSYSQNKLTSNPKLNVWLGSEYLDDLLKTFDGSYVLSLASYNAGPYRVRQWIKENGDPRTDNADYVVDWVELIPFNETRNYVQRVLENIQVYRHKFNGTKVAYSLESDLQRR